MPTRIKPGPPEDLYIGTTLRIPPREDLRRDLIETPRSRSADKAQTVRGNSNDSPRSSDRGTRRAGAVLLQVDPTTEGRRKPAPSPEPTRLARTYEVRRDNETLRTIAREVLGKSDRDGEIEQLNREELEATNGRVEKGMKLTLPPKSSDDDG